MSSLDPKKLRKVLSIYVEKNNVKGVYIFSLDLVMYILSIGGVIYFENICIKLILGVVAGTYISSLFVVGHDAAHGSLTDSSFLNKIIARVAFLPSLHNYRLWLIAHNRIHHQYANVKGMNSWSPYTKKEFNELSFFRKKLERLYRTIPGFCLYYLLERWWKHKFYPFKSIVNTKRKLYFVEFFLVFTYLMSYITGLIYIGGIFQYNSPIQMVVIGFFVPFLTWNFMGGFTIYQHHTHQKIPWARLRDEQVVHDDVTMHVQYPKWYNFISHNIMEHTAHHIDPRIPCYNLSRAQKKLVNYIGENANTVRFSIRGLLETLKSCKLYDFDANLWLDFDGVATTREINTGHHEITRAKEKSISLAA